MNNSSLFSVTTWLIPVFVSVILHEIAHGLVAKKLGDDTAYNQGRLSLNPLKHVDPIGTIIFPLFLFLSGSPFVYGWAKPVPISIFKLKSPTRGMALVALAGPLTNFLIAVLFVISSIFFKYLPDNMFGAWIVVLAVNFFKINIALAAFNLFLLPPLDGARILGGIIPPKYALKLLMFDRKGMVILFMLLIIPPYVLEITGIDVDILRWYVVNIKSFLSKIAFLGIV